MKFGRLVGAWIWSTALLLPSGAALAGAGPNILQGVFSFDDINIGSGNCHQVQVDGDLHQAGGVLSATGLNADTVVLSYVQPFVESVQVKPKGAQVRQKEFSELSLDITPGAGSPTIAYAGIARPDKGKILGRIVRGGAQSRAAASFDLGENFVEMVPALDADQQATFLAAFADRNDIQIKEKNGQVRIKHRGEPSGGCP